MNFITPLLGDNSISAPKLQESAIIEYYNGIPDELYDFIESLFFIGLRDPQDFNEIHIIKSVDYEGIYGILLIKKETNTTIDIYNVNIGIIDKRLIEVQCLSRLLQNLINGFFLRNSDNFDKRIQLNIIGVPSAKCSLYSKGITPVSTQLAQCIIENTSK